MGALPSPSTMQAPVPSTQPAHRFQNFISLQWYEETITFLFTFVAKTSEILLAAGLVTSTANFLTDGKVMGTGSAIANAWAWAQALAIDSSLSVTFVHVFTSLKQRDWLKAVCYGLLTCLLAFVAGTITNVDTLSHAVHITIANATSQVGLDVKLLTTLRAIAVVGFVLMSRLKEVSFKELYEPPASATPHTITRQEETEALLSQVIAKILAQEGQIVITEEQETLSPPLDNQPEPNQTLTEPLTVQSPDQQGTSEVSESQDALPEERETRLQQAYQELQAEGGRISGRTLAARAHIRRTTCNQWLAAHHPDQDNDTG